MRNSRRVQDSDLSYIIIELSKKWASGIYGNHLTWSALESQFGFTRQTLQSKPGIKAAYHYAKKSLSQGLVGALDENVALKMRVAELEAQLRLAWSEKSFGEDVGSRLLLTYACVAKASLPMTRNLLFNCTFQKRWRRISFAHLTNLSHRLVGYKRDFVPCSDASAQSSSSSHHFCYR